MRKDIRRARGDKAEEFVADQLRQQGLQIYARNYQKKYGEVDIIAGNAQQLLFIEVKMRVQEVDHMAALVTPSKQKKIGMAARAYLTEHAVIDKVCRFDVALVLAPSDDDYSMSYIVNAFSI